MVKSTLASFLKEALDKIADYTKYVHLIVYASVWALLFLILFLMGAPFFVPLILGGVVNLLIGFLFWFLPSLLVKKRSTKGENWKPLLSIINIGLIRYLALPCWSIFFFVLIVSSFFSLIGKNEEKPSLISKNSELVQQKDAFQKLPTFKSEDEAKKRFEQLTIAAEKGDPEAQTDLALMYDRGEGVNKNNEEAVKWYRLAAEKGYARAQRNLAISFDDGEGVPQDYEEALKWYKLAVEQGDSDAQYNLARLYYWKRGGSPQDYEEAFKWGSLAAEQGDPLAQYFLGMLYLRGYGTEFDFEKGMMFNKLALDQGIDDAEFVIKTYEEVSTPAEIRKIQKLVKEWKRNHAN